MKTIIITAFLLLSTATWAAEDVATKDLSKPVQCAKFEHLVRALSKDPYNEIPVWMGNDGQDASKYVLFANAKKGTWTLIQFGTEVGCILGAGKDSSITDPGTKL